MYTAVGQIAHVFAALAEDVISGEFGERIFGQRCWIEFGFDPNRHQIAGVVGAGVMVFACASAERPGFGPTTYFVRCHNVAALALTP